MAKASFVKYQGTGVFGKDYAPKYFNLATKVDNAKTFTELQAVLAHNSLSKMDMFIDEYAAPFKIFHKGKINGALGAGLRFIEAGGTLPVKQYVDPAADSTVCLKIPNNANDRDEILKSVVQLDCSGRMPNYLWGSSIFISPEEMIKFQNDKIGEIRGSISLIYALFWNYVLSIDPWGEEAAHTKNFSDYVQNFGVGSILGMSVEQNTDPHAKTLKGIIDDDAVKKEVDKERKIANKCIYHINDWIERKVTAGEKQAAKDEMFKSPTAELDATKIEKMYKDNSSCSPLENMGALASCLLTRINEMLRPSARNSSLFPGNNKDSFAGWGATKDKFHYISRTTKDRLVIIMNVYLLDQLKAVNGSTYTESVVPLGRIKELLSYTIIGIENIPYGCIKIADKDRYNEYTLKAYQGEDTLDQERVKIYNYHHDIVWGIREFPCACALRIHGLYMNPMVEEAIGKYNTLVELK